MEVFTPGSHGCTFGGNPLAAAVGIKALEIIEEENFCQRSVELGDYLITHLKKLKNPLIREIRGKGLLVGLDLEPENISGRKVCEELLKVGILTKETHETVVRLAPPLVIKKEEIDWALAGIRKVFETAF